MKKIISLIISSLIVFSAIPLLTFSVSADTINSDDTGIWCYVGSKAGQSTSADSIYYKADATNAENHKYATAKEALDAAFDEAANASGMSVFLNQNIILDEAYTVAPNVESKKDVRLNINGFTVTSTVTNSSAFIIDGTKVNEFHVYGGTPKSDADSFVSSGDNSFFASSTRSPEKLLFNGTFNGDISDSITNMVQLDYTVVNGNYYHNSTSMILQRAAKIYGDIRAKGLVQFSANGGAYVDGDIVTEGSVQVVVPNTTVNGNVVITGNSECAITTSDNATNLVINGDITANSASTSKPAIEFKKGVYIGGKTTVTGKSADVAFANCTFGKGLDNKTNAEFTLDDTDKVGTVFYNGDKYFDTSLNTYGAVVTAPKNIPVKDSFTFVGWADKNGNEIDFENAAPTQGLNNEYFAKFSSFSDKHIEVSTDNYYLPNANSLTSDGEKIVCYKNSKGKIVNCGSLAENGEVYDAVTVKFNQKSGAQMRLSTDLSGLRFLSDIKTADLDTIAANNMKIVELGTKIGPQEYFEDSSKVDDDYLMVVAADFYKTDSANKTLAGSIVAIKDHNLNRNFVGQGYLKIKLPDESVVTVTAVLGNDFARSVYKVASLANLDSSLSAEKKAVVKSYLDAVVIINDGLIEVPDGYSTPYIYTGKKVIPNKSLGSTTSNIRLVVLDSVKYYKDSLKAPIAAIITDAPDTDDVTELRFDSFTVNTTDYSGKTVVENAVLMLPKTYTENGEPTRLIIDCHGFTGSASNLSKGIYKNLQYFAHQGYAVLEVDGGGSEGLYSMGNVGAVNGNVDAYNYCIKNYNLKKEVFVKGSSMGGLVSQNLVTSGRIPVLAYVGDSPVTSFYRQLYCESWDPDNISRVSRFYNFDFSNSGYNSTTFPYTKKSKKVSELERQLFIDNFKDKVASVNGIWKYCSQFFDYNTKEFKTGFEDFLTATDSARIEELYNSIAIDFPVPYMISHGTKDVSVSYNYSKRFVEAVNRGNGKKAVLKTYDTNTHCDLGELTSYPCKDGSQFEANSSYGDMLNFFRQYE